MRRLLAAAAVALVASCTGHPAYADPEIPAAATEAGKRDGGWVRVVCSGTTADQRCHLRFPDGFRRLDVTYVHGGDDLGVASTWDHSTPGRVRDRARRWDARVTSGVRVSCWTVGAWADCTVRIRERVRDYRDTYWSAGVDQGGLIFDADA